MQMHLICKKAHMLITLPADCPGTSSEQAGKSSACAGCPNQQICATAPKGPDPGEWTEAPEY